MARRESRAASALPTLRVTVRYALPGLCIAALLIAAMFVFHEIENFLIGDPRFALSSPGELAQTGPDIRLEGIVHASQSRVLDAFEEDTGRSLYLLPLAERRRSLLAVDWVKDASVSRIWPNRVEVRIEEREPVAFVQLPLRRRGTPFHAALIDEDGVILEQPPRSHYNLPVLIGIRPEQSEAARRQRVQRMLQLLEEIGPLGNQISEVDVSNPDNLKVTHDADGKAVTLILGRESFLSRLRNFLKHYPEIRRRMPAATTLDLRADDRITVVDGGGDGG